VEKAKLEEFERALRGVVKGDVSFDEVTRGIYATDASFYQITPVAVVRPRDEADVRAAVKTAAEFDVTIVPRGGGTSLGGQAVGHSMIVDFSKYMNNVLQVNTDERWARVEPGVVLDELNAELAQHGLQFAPDPATGNRATIGGMMGNNSSGTKSIIFGKTSDHVLAGKVLLSDGSRIGRAAPGRNTQRIQEDHRDQQRRDRETIPQSNAPRQRLQPGFVRQYRPLESDESVRRERRHAGYHARGQAQP
jgi:FAD/FMN-containing dehydrogenase